MSCTFLYAKTINIPILNIFDPKNKTRSRFNKMLKRRTIHYTDLLFRLPTVHEHSCQTILVDIRTWKWAMKKWPFRNGKVSAMEAPLCIPRQHGFLPLVDSISCCPVFCRDPYRRRSLSFFNHGSRHGIGLIDKVFTIVGFR